MTHALVVGAAPAVGGEAFYAELLAHAPVVVAADAAAEWCVELGRRPDLAVGDFDSSRPGAPGRLAAEGVPVERYPSAKDASDLDLAVAGARRLGATLLTFTAVTSARLDHTLASLGTVLAAVDLSAEIAEPGLAAWALEARARPSLTVSGREGALVSVFAVGGPARVDISGLRYELSHALLEPLSSRGLSNQVTGSRGTVTVEEGAAIVLADGAPGIRAEAR